MTDYGFDARRRLFTDRRRPMPLIRTVIAFLAGACVAAIFIAVTR